MAMTETKERNNIQRVRFGIAEWLALVGMAVAPASGFGYWGLQMSVRMALIEQRQGITIETLESLVGVQERMIATQQQMGINQLAIVQLTEKCINLQRDLDRIEHGRQQNKTTP